MSMQVMRSAVFFALAICATGQIDITLVTFDGSPATTYKFQELNDPVMGGKSTGTWEVDAAKKVGVFDGVVATVPSLKAPGFIKSAADGKFPDASSAINGDLVLTVRTSTPEYKGFRVSFASGTLSPAYSCAGGGSIPFSRGCFKAKFSVPAGDEFTAIRIPFKNFSDKWSPSTGEQTTTCAQDTTVCPTAQTLKGIKRIEVWAEGADGKVHLEVHSIFADTAAVAHLGKGHLEVQSIVAGSTGAAFSESAATIVTSGLQSRPPKQFDTCSGPIQNKLRYGISGRTQAIGPYPVDQTETLADAIC